MHTFIDDIAFQDLLYGLTVRSTVAKGRITSLTIPTLPEGYFSVTALEIPGDNFLSYFGLDMPFLAESEVNYIGEPIVLLAGESRDVLTDIAQEVHIEYIEGEPVFTLRSAEMEGITDQIYYSLGDIESAFQNAYQIVEGEYCTGSQEHLYPEAQGALAHWDGKSLSIFASTQDPFSIRNTLTKLLDLTQRKIRVVVPQIGDPLEGKLLPSILIAGHAALLSYTSGKPVKLVYDRVEDFHFTLKGHASLIQHKTAIDRDGNPTGMKVDILLDAGAYPVNSSQVLTQAALAACGGYRCANIEVKAKLALTNKIPSGSFRGMGRSQAFFAIELHTARLEEILQLDPYNWKKENLLEAGNATPTGGRMKGFVGAKYVLEEVVRFSDFRRKYASCSAMKKRRKSLQDSQNPLRGIGLSICSQGIGYSGSQGQGETGYSVRVRFDTNRKLKIFSSMVEMGQDVKKIFTDLAARILNLDPSKVIIEPVNTQKVPNTGPTSLAGTLHIAAKLIEQSCLAIQERRIKSSLPIEVKRSYKPPKELSWDPKKFQGDPFEMYSWAGTVVEIEVDPVILHPVCRGIWMAVDAGSVWDKEWAGAKLEGGIIQALGYTAIEVLEFEQGSIKEKEFFEYQVPGISDVPPIMIHFVEENELQAAGGIKAFDELPFMGFAPAYAAAVSQATGLYIDRIPLTPEEIQKCLETA